MASCGYYAPEHPGRICRNGIRLTRLAIGDSSNGSGKVFQYTSNAADRPAPFEILPSMKGAKLELIVLSATFIFAFYNS
jgi:hypothetical protein